MTHGSHEIIYSLIAVTYVGKHDHAMSQRTYRDTVHPENVIDPIFENHILRAPLCIDMWCLKCL